MLCCASGGEFLLMRAVRDCCSFTGKSTLLGEKRMEIHKHTQVRTGALILKFTVDCLPAWLVGSYWSLFNKGPWSILYIIACREYPYENKDGDEVIKDVLSICQPSCMPYSASLRVLVIQQFVDITYLPTQWEVGRSDNVKDIHGFLYEFVGTLQPTTRFLWGKVPRTVPRINMPWLGDSRHRLKFLYTYIYPAFFLPFFSPFIIRDDMRCALLTGLVKKMK